MKDGGKSAAVSHLDKTLDDYIKSAKKTSGVRNWLYYANWKLP